MIATQLNDCLILNNGLKIPQVGLGVWRAADGDETRNAVRWALETGYRSIDTASLYNNEKSVGEGLRQSGLARDEVFVTTKVWNNDHGYDNALKAFDKSLKLLGLEYVDMYLLHYPVTGKFLETWKALEKLLEDGSVRAIGVSNFHIHHLDDLLAHARIRPVVNQIELHPYLSQKALIQYHRENGILTEAWAPIAKGRVLGEKIITELSSKYDKTPAQIVLRWELQQGIIVIPKSVHLDRIEENTRIFDFVLSDEDMARIDTLERNGRIGVDPDKMEY